MNASDAQIDAAISKLQRIICGAENSNHASECAVIRAAAAHKLESALRLILPDLRHSISSGDGRFTPSQLEAIETALNEASGADQSVAVAA